MKHATFPPAPIYSESLIDAAHARANSDRAELIEYAHRHPTPAQIRAALSEAGVFVSQAQWVEVMRIADRNKEADNA